MKIFDPSPKKHEALNWIFNPILKHWLGVGWCFGAGVGGSALPLFCHPAEDCGKGKVQRRLCVRISARSYFVFQLSVLFSASLVHVSSSPVAATLRESQKRETAVIKTVSPCDAKLLRCWPVNTWVAPSMKLLSYLPSPCVHLASRRPSRVVLNRPNFMDGGIKNLVAEIMCVVKASMNGCVLPDHPFAARA